MTDTKTKKTSVKEGKKSSSGKSRNYVLPNGVLRYSRSKMYRKKASYKIKPKKVVKPKKEMKPKFIEKPIGGDKNGGKRMVRTTKTAKFYPTEPATKKRKSRKAPFSKHLHKLRKSITPGTVLILIAGRHRGKRVIFLKQLLSGLLLVTGPLKLNGCPLRRIEPSFVIATKTKVDISSLKLSSQLKDGFFKRKTLKKSSKEDGDIFEANKKEYKVTQRRKKVQIDVDKQLLNIIKKHPERGMLSSYLSSLFWLRNKMYPHNMIF